MKIKKQSDPMDCFFGGGACLTMIMSCFGNQPNVNQIKMLCSLDRSGVSLLGMTDYFGKMKDIVYDSWSTSKDSLTIHYKSKTMKSRYMTRTDRQNAISHFSR